MNTGYLGIMAVVAGLLFPTAALAAGPNSSSVDRTAIINALQTQEQADEFKAKFWTQEPITQQDYYVQAKYDRQLISKISAGEPVSQDELAQALKRVETPY